MQNENTKPKSTRGRSKKSSDAEKPKMGRPSKQDNISKEQFEALCSIQCTLEEVCCVLDVSPPTLEAWVKKTYGPGYTFLKIFKIKRCNGLVSLRRNQLKLSETNATMAIFLGKNYLGQSDNPTNDKDTNIEDDELSKALEELGKEL